MRFFFGLLLFLVSLNASSEIYDEVEAGEVSENEIINRPMSAGFSLNSIQVAFDESKAIDNTLVLHYQENVTYKVRLREFIETQFILPEGEEIAAHVLGDSTNFTFIPFNSAKYDLGNMFTVRPTYSGADTNLTIIGKSGNVYSFYIRSDSFESNHVPHFVVKFQGEETTTSIPVKNTVSNDLDFVNFDIQESDKDYLRSLPDFDLKNMNINYVKTSGKKDLSPNVIFDDGYWTYFVYDDLDKPKNLPVFYKVIDGYDSPAITRRVGNMIIAESISNAWTLRSGTAHICVRLKE